MALIKKADFHSVARQAIVLDLGDLGRQAEALERRAVDKANQIVDGATKERQRLMSGASDEGRAAGHAEGLEAGTAEGKALGHAQALAESAARFEALAKSWEAGLKSFEDERDEMIQTARADAMAFAAAVAERITKRVVAMQPGVAVDVLASALAMTIKPSRLVIEVSAADRAAVMEAAPALVARFAKTAHSEVVVSESLSQGSVVVRTDEGSIDASIETQIERILDAALPDRAKRVEPAAAAEPAAIAEAIEPQPESDAEPESVPDEAPPEEPES